MSYTSHDPNAAADKKEVLEDLHIVAKGDRSSIEMESLMHWLIQEQQTHEPHRNRPSVPHRRLQARLHAVPVPDLQGLGQP